MSGGAWAYVVGVGRPGPGWEQCSQTGVGRDAGSRVPEREEVLACAVRCRLLEGAWILLEW